MLRKLVHVRLRRAEAKGPGISALAFLGLVAAVLGGLGAIVSWLVWSNLGIGVGITGGVAIVASGGLFVWSESRPGPRAAPPRDESEPADRPR